MTPLAFAGCVLLGIGVAAVNIGLGVLLGRATRPRD
jgi:hypothetical protein